MKKLLAIVLTVCMLTGVLCVASVPVSAGGFTFFLCGLADDGRIWAIGVYDHFDQAWNEAVYCATHPDEAWNEHGRYDDEENLIEGTYLCIILDIYADLNADDRGSFGTGAGFKDGAIYVPKDAQIEVNLNGSTIRRGDENGQVLYIDAGADFSMFNGSVIGDIYADKSAKTTIRNVYVSGKTVQDGNGSARTASIFGEGSFAMIVAFTALIASVAALVVNVSSKKKAAPAAASNTKSKDGA